MPSDLTVVFGRFRRAQSSEELVCEGKKSKRKSRQFVADWFRESVKRAQTVDDRNLLLRELPGSLEVPHSRSFTERLDLVRDLSSEPFPFVHDGVLGDDGELSEGDDCERKEGRSATRGSKEVCGGQKCEPSSSWKLVMARTRESGWSG